MYRYVYGPIPSRRLGISLGVDLIPHKICSFNCVYCECGSNTRLTPERKEWVSAEEILSELRDYMKKHPAPDVISFSGSGEPTLHSRLGYILSTLKREFPGQKLAVLTNSSMMPVKEVRSDLLNADIVLPSLDAATEKAYIAIDRPHPSLKLPAIIDGLARFREEFKAVSPEKEIWLEIFLIEGLNTDEENISALKAACETIRPDRVQLNTLDRPGTESWVKPLPVAELERIAWKMGLPNVEVISKYHNRSDISAFREDVADTIIDTVSRRPSTIDDLAAVLKLHVHQVARYLEVLESEGKIRPVAETAAEGRGIFYTIMRDES